MTAWRFVLLTWPRDPSVTAGCAGAALAYLAATGWRLRAGGGWFFAGLGALELALASPIDTLGDRYLFSVHMVQHMLLTLAVAPLLVAGTPPDVLRRALDRPALGRPARLLGYPLVAWVLGVGALWAWHAPLLYNAALADLRLHIVQHLSFLVTGVIFWWPVLAPLPEARLRPLPGMLYLLAAMLACSGLGIVLAFAAPDLYPAYLAPADRFGILPLLRSGWGLSPEADQQLGGLLMWVVGMLVYLGAILGLLARWYREAERRPAVAAREG